VKLPVKQVPGGRVAVRPQVRVAVENGAVVLITQRAVAPGVGDVEDRAQVGDGRRRGEGRGGLKEGPRLKVAHAPIPLVEEAVDTRGGQVVEAAVEDLLAKLCAVHSG